MIKQLYQTIICIKNIIEMCYKSQGIILEKMQDTDIIQVSFTVKEIKDFRNSVNAFKQD